MTNWVSYRYVEAMLYCMVRVPWYHMAEWIDWLDTMAPDWEFGYPDSPHVAKNSFALELLFSYELGHKHLDSCAHMRVCMPKEQMILHKLAWNVDNIADNKYGVVG